MWQNQEFFILGLGFMTNDNVDNDKFVYKWPKDHL